MITIKRLGWVLFISVGIIFTGIVLYKKVFYYELKNLKKITKGGHYWDLRFVSDDISKKVSFYSDSLKIYGDLYDHEKSKKPSGIILLHGTNILGRKQPIILSLAEKFYQLNYSVLTIDFRGYGESEDPKYPITLESLDFAQDVISAVDFLLDKTAVDENNIYIVGHSFGAGVALAAQSRDKRIKKMALFGPPRRVTERILVANAPDRFLLGRFIKHMQLDFTPDTLILEESIESRNIENYVDDFNEHNHIPILLVDGEDEDINDREFLRKIYHKMTPPVSYWTVPRANHYLNTGYFLGKPSYCEKTLTLFVNVIDEWFRNSFIPVTHFN